jgi:uncharacterized protein with PhoU and TrkA domain
MAIGINLESDCTCKPCTLSHSKLSPEEQKRAKELAEFIADNKWAESGEDMSTAADDLADFVLRM